jgi:hypothetical protein
MRPPAEKWSRHDRRLRDRLPELCSRLRGIRTLAVVIRNDSDYDGDLGRLAENVEQLVFAVDIMLAALERDGVPA